MTKKYRQPHESYLTEWLGMNFPPGSWRTNVTVGKVKVPENMSLLPEEYANLREALGAQADAMVFLPDQVIIVEAMIRHEPGVLEDLLKYKRLFFKDDTFEKYWSMPLRLLLLTPLDLGEYEKMAVDMGIEVVHYNPAWVQAYLATYPRRAGRGKTSSVEF
jgi:hypothetical protein